MSEKPVALGGLLNTENRPTDTGILQCGAGQSIQEKKPKREGKKHLAFALDGETYRHLRMHAAETDQTHQDILETALAEYLKRANALLRKYATLIVGRFAQNTQTCVHGFLPKLPF